MIVETHPVGDGICEFLFLNQALKQRQLPLAGASPVGVNGDENRFARVLRAGEGLTGVGMPFDR